MSSSDALHPLQLQMFMPARELQGLTPSDFNPVTAQDRRVAAEAGLTLHRPSTVDEMWANKLEESKAEEYNIESERSLHDRIASEGVKEPVQVTRTAADFGEGTSRAHLSNQDVLFDGHHRVAAAANIDPNMEVPVEHFNIQVY